MVSEAVPEEIKSKLRGIFAVLDPLRLLDEIRAAQEMVAGVAAGRVNEAATRDQDAELDQLLKRLSTAWQEGEVRPTHRQAPKPRRHWRTRKDPYATVWPTICGWLDAEPARTAKELFRRLQSQNIGTFPDSQLRTLQRRVKEWRSEMARQLVYAEASCMISAPPAHDLLEELDHAEDPRTARNENRRLVGRSMRPIARPYPARRISLSAYPEIFSVITDVSSNNLTHLCFTSILFSDIIEIIHENS